MISSLYLIALEGKKTIYFCKYRLWISSVVLMKEIKILFDKLKLLLSYSFKHIFVIIGKEEKLPTSSTLSFN